MTDTQLGKSLAVIPGNAQDIGKRSEQQDSFAFSAFDDHDWCHHAGILAVVADGMGGLAMGKDASDLAVRTMLTSYDSKGKDEPIGKALVRSLKASNTAVNDMASKAGLEGDVGTTLVAVVIHDGLLYRIAAGDSRIYLFRGNELRRLTTDYNYGRVLDRMVLRGEMGRDEAESHPSRAALTSYLGKSTLETEDYDDPDDEPLLLQAGDRILLCSDGLFNTLAEDEIVARLNGEPQAASENLIAAVLSAENPYQDNVTVAILGYGLPPADSLLPKTKMENKTFTPKEKEKNTDKPKNDKLEKTPPAKSKRWLVVVVIAVLAVVGFFIGRNMLGGDLVIPKKQPLAEPPVQEQPVKEQPAKEQPAQEQPTGTTMPVKP